MASHAYEHQTKCVTIQMQVMRVWQRGHAVYESFISVQKGGCMKGAEEAT